MLVSILNLRMSRTTALEGSVKPCCPLFIQTLRFQLLHPITLLVAVSVMSKFDRAAQHIKQTIQEAKDEPYGKSDFTRAVEFAKEKMSSRHNPPSSPGQKHKRSSSFTERLEAFASSTAKSLLKSAAPHGPPLRRFQDMNDTERNLLSNILCHQPPPNASRDQSWWREYEAQTKSAILKLPDPLRGYPKLIDRWVNRMVDDEFRAYSKQLCSIHEKLNRMLVRSTLHFIKKDIDVTIPALLRPLKDAGKLIPEYAEVFDKMQDASAMWLNSQNFEAFFGRKPARKFRNQKDQCAACVVARLGSDINALIGLKAGMIMKSPRRPGDGSRRTPTSAG